MHNYQLIAICLCIAAISYFWGWARINRFANAAATRPNSLPLYYGAFPALLGLILPGLIMIIWLVSESIIMDMFLLGSLPDEIVGREDFSGSVALAQIYNLADGISVGQVEEWVSNAAAQFLSWKSQSNLAMIIIAIGASLGGCIFALSRIHLDFRARNAVERIIYLSLIACSVVAIITTIGIVFSVIFESIRFFRLIPPLEFLTGLTWNPEFEGAARAGSGQGGSAAYGSIPLFVGTFLISIIALTVAIPIGLLSAIYLSEYATKSTRSLVKPALEILAGVPTVVYGFFAALTIAPLFKGMGESIGLSVASESALAAGFVMGIMIIPFISSLSDDVINSVPQSLRDAAYGLGSTKSEAVKNVVLPAALSGIVASIILAVSRAVGETMIVVMAAGLAANLTVNPLDAVTTVTAQIVTILVGDQEFESAKTLSAFALALTLIVITLGLNFIALRVVKKYREQYD
ncbi:MAG: phosphate ABC transporter permease subunit PstC [Alphaproteobacteria bacterium]|nr:phosphate ABC transporter permease subunit PstC [Alphaproteobacteria bacterium]